MNVPMIVGWTLSKLLREFFQKFSREMEIKKKNSSRLSIVISSSKRKKKEEDNKNRSFDPRHLYSLFFLIQIFPSSSQLGLRFINATFRLRHSPWRLEKLAYGENSPCLSPGKRAVVGEKGGDVSFRAMRTIRKRTMQRKHLSAWPSF